MYIYLGNFYLPIRPDIGHANLKVITVIKLSWKNSFSRASHVEESDTKILIGHYRFRNIPLIIKYLIFLAYPKFKLRDYLLTGNTSNARYMQRGHGPHRNFKS